MKSFCRTLCVLDFLEPIYSAIEHNTTAIVWQVPKSSPDTGFNTFVWVVHSACAGYGLYGSRTPSNFTDLRAERKTFLISESDATKTRICRLFSGRWGQDGIVFISGWTNSESYNNVVKQTGHDVVGARSNVADSSPYLFDHSSVQRRQYSLVMVCCRMPGGQRLHLHQLFVRPGQQRHLGAVIDASSKTVLTILAGSTPQMSSSQKDIIDDVVLPNEIVVFHRATPR